MLKRWYRLSSGDQPDKQRLVAILCLAILYHNIHVGSMDKKMLRSIFDTHKYFPLFSGFVMMLMDCCCSRVIVSFHLVGDQLFTPTEFLLQSIPGLDKTMDKKVLTSVSQTKVLLIERQLEELGKEAQLTEQQCSEWMSQMDQNLVVPEQKEEPTKIMEEWVTERSSLILKGAHLADKITRFLKCVLNGYSGENRTISKSNTNHIFKMIQLVQVVYNPYFFLNFMPFRKSH
jgi:hypothetical protein